MSTGKEYHELVLDLLEQNSSEIKDMKKDVNKELSDLKTDFTKQCSEIKEDIAELRTAKHVVRDYKEWRGKVDDVWSPPQMKEVKDEVYIQKGQWTKTIGILIGIELVVGVILFFVNK
jgi:ElaB/YqjD/DUF883 family membrane-anchored ribosome-binding protein